MSKLVIVESPTKVKTISNYLGSEYEIVASVGHIRDLPKGEKDSIDIEHGFEPKYVISKQKQPVVNDIIKKVKKASEVLLATDPDREGEAIAWHLQQVADLKNPQRIVFNEITKDAVLEALKHPRKIDQSLRKSQEARRVLDRLFGYTLSKLVWTKVRYGLSAGRVQSPALRILMEREREIRAFIPETYYELSAVMQRKDNTEYLTLCEKTLSEKKEVDHICAVSKNRPWHIDSIKKTTQQRKPKAPFTTSSLQQAANSILSWSPSQTMRIAQKLYEAGQITYMRTDSTYIAASAQKTIKKRIEEEFGSALYKSTVYKTKQASAQEAHEAIRPSNPANAHGGMSADEKKLYGLIYRRTLASQMIPAEIVRTVVYFTSGEDIPKFVIRGALITTPGWYEADPFARAEEQEVPDFKEGEKFSCIDIQSKEKQTQPPQRYSEAGLVKALEERGIGRPSTYASTIYTLIDRKYVDKEQRSLKPTQLGDVVSTFIEKNFDSYISDDFTAHMELTLDAIANGDADYEKTLSDFYFPFKKSVESKKDIEKLNTIGEAPKEFPCPKCGSSMEYKLSKIGVFMSCTKFPECTGGRTETGDEMKQSEPVGKQCPKCDSELVRKTGRFGDFIGCSAYPKCKYIESDPKEMALKDSGVKCTECKKGTMIERNGRYGIFYSCSEYPDCKYAIKTRPTGEHCTECGSLMMEGTKTIPDRCSVKTCPMHNPHKL